MFNLTGFSRLSLFALLVFGGASRAEASDILKIQNDLAIWNPNTVTWSVDANSDTDDICQIHWIYDDEIDVSLKQNRENLYYFGIDYLGNKKRLKQLFNRGDFDAILVANGDQINLGSERIDSNTIIAIAPTAINSIDALKQAEALFLKSGDALYSFPLENTTENFDVYRQCLKDNNQYVERSRVAQAATPEVSMDDGSNAPVSDPIAESASLMPVSSAPIDDMNVGGADLLFGNAVSMADNTVSAAPSMAVDIKTPGVVTDVNNAPSVDRVSKKDATDNAPYTPASVDPFLDPEGGEETAPVSNMVSLDNSKQPEVELRQEVINEAPDQEVVIVAQEDVQKLPDELTQKPKKYTKGPDAFLGDDLAYADGVGENKKGSDGSDDAASGDACGKGQVDENITGVIQNLTRKLRILEKEKEALRVKMIAGASGNQAVVSELLACKTDGASEADMPPEEDLGIAKKYQVMLEDMKLEIENLRTENELLNAAVTDAPSIGDISQAPQTAALNSQINDLEVKNLQLQKEISEYKKIISENADSADIQPEMPAPMPITMDVDPFMDENAVISPVIEPSQIENPIEVIEQTFEAEPADIVPNTVEELDWETIEQDLSESVNPPEMPEMPAQ